MSYKLIKEKFKEEINNLKTELEKINDGTVVLDNISQNVTKIAENVISAANASSSIDQRITLLGSGLQKIILYIQTENDSLKDNMSNIKNKLEYIETFENKIDFLIDEEKKSNTTIQREKIQNEE